MSITVKELIENLQNKDQEALVEFIVVKDSGELVCCDVSSQAKSITKLLKLFKSND